MSSYGWGFMPYGLCRVIVEGDKSLNVPFLGCDLEAENEQLASANQDLANEVVDLHARLRAYEDVAGDTARAQLLEDMLEDCIDTLQWLASGNEMCYAHDVDVIARDFRGRLDQLNAGGGDDDA